MKDMPDGAMTAVPLSEERASKRIEGREGLWLAAVNGPSLCTVSGRPEAIAALEAQLSGDGLACRRLHTSHAFHSGLMDAAVAPFVATVREISLSAPRLPYVSNVTGDWITEAEARDPEYWGRHLRQPVRFADGVRRLLADSERALLEVGPGRALGTLARQQPDRKPSVVVSSLRAAQSERPDSAVAMEAVAQLWTSGVSIDWERFHQGPTRRRVVLPTYPFERARYWVDRREAAPAVERAELGEWFHLPGWRRAAPPTAVESAGRCLVLGHDSAFGLAVVAALEQAGREVSAVAAIPSSREELGRVLSDLDGALSEIVYLGGLSAEEPLERCFHTPIALLQALDDAALGRTLRLALVTTAVHEVAAGDEVCPEKATVLGPCRVVGRELPHVRCRHIDVAAADVAACAAPAVTALVEELTSNADEPVVALRGGHRFVETFARVPLGEREAELSTPLRRGATYLITGGLGGMGLELAHFLARSAGANLVITARHAAPERCAAAVASLEAAGAQVLVAAADVANFAQMRGVVEQANARFGSIDGVVHAAGVAGGGVILLKERSAADAVLRPKIEGARVLERLFEDASLDFLVLCSSVTAVRGDPGQVDYCAANAYLDAFARRFGARTGTHAVSIGWNRWRQVGMAVEAARALGHHADSAGCSNAEGVEAFARILAARLEPHVVLSHTDLWRELAREGTGTTSTPVPSPAGSEASEASSYPRPDLASDFVAPRSETETVVADAWKQMLGIESIGVDDDFFELGGHSLLATQLLGRLNREDAGAALTLRSIFDNPTVAQLASYMESSARTPTRRLEPVSRDQLLALSPAQERFWLLSQLEGDQAAYNVALPMRLRGALDVAALEWSLGEIVRRHEVLRTTFTYANAQLALSIAEPAAVDLPVVDLAHQGDPHREAQRVAQEAYQCPIDLGVGPLYRFLLLRLGPDDHVLQVTLHHATTDEWSVGVFCRELAQLYEAHHAGRPSPLPELSVQYADYAHWQRQWYEDDVQRDLIYWKDQLDALPALELATDRPRPAMQTFRGSVRTFAIPAAAARELKAIGASEGCTTFMATLAVFKLLLARYSGQHDIVVGTPIANRRMPETEPLIGLFLNTLVLRTDLSGDPSFRAVLRRVRGVSLEAFHHGDMPFERLVTELRPERDTSRNPLFQVLFVTNAPPSGLSLGGVRIEPFGLARVSAMFDLTLSVVETDDGMLGAFEYNRDLFDDTTIERMAHHLGLLLEGVVAHPDRCIWDATIVTDRELQLFAERNATACDHDDRSVVELFEARVKRSPDTVAAVCGAATLTAADLNRRANQLAHHLRSLGAGPQTLVGISVSRSLDMLVGLLGILKSSAAYVPLDPSHPSDRLAFILDDAGIDLLVTQENLLSELPVELPPLVRLDVDAASIAARSAENPAQRARAEDLAYVIYTSGSTGRPKGVQIEHRALANLLHSMAREPGMSADDVLLAVTTISFDIAGLELFLPLLVGGAVVITENDVEADGRRLSALIDSSGATMMQATPATWQLLLEAGWEGCAALKALCGGEALPRELAEQLLPRCGELWNMYGPTETTIWSLVHRVQSGSGPVPIGVPIGAPIANTELYLLDAHWQSVPIGVPGQLYLGGRGLARGYLNRPELTAERFLACPFSAEAGARIYDTGDRARLRADGTLEFLGRTDHQVKVRGFRIELGEIEHVLAGHEAVNRCAVVAQAAPTGGHRLVSHVVLESGASPTVGELRQHLHDKLPDYMVPAAFAILDELPLTPNGKVDRAALMHAAGARVAGAAQHVPPSTPTELLVAEVWREVLGVDAVGIHDNFFDLGGHSLLAMKAVFRLEEQIGERLSPMDLLVPDLGEFARTCDARVGMPARHVEPVARDQQLPLSPAQERFWFLAQLEQDSSVYNVPFALRLRGALDVGALEWSLGEIVRRHETLRTTFTIRGDQLSLVIAAPAAVGLPVTDLSGADDPKLEAHRLMREESHLPFDLSVGPVYRFALLRLAPDEHVLLITMHHATIDEWSVGVFCREMAQLYEARIAKLPSPLADLTVQYADYAFWQRKWYEEEAAKRPGLLEAAAGSAADARTRDRPTAAGVADVQREYVCLHAPGVGGKSTEDPGQSRRLHLLHGHARGVQAAAGATLRAAGHRGGHPARQPGDARDRAPDRLVPQHPRAAHRPVGRPELPRARGPRAPGFARWIPPRHHAVRAARERAAAGPRREPQPVVSDPVRGQRASSGFSLGEVQTDASSRGQRLGDVRHHAEGGGYRRRSARHRGVQPRSVRPRNDRAHGAAPGAPARGDRGASGSMRLGCRDRDRARATALRRAQRHRMR